MMKTFTVECIYSIDTKDDHQWPTLTAHRNRKRAFGNLTKASGKTLKIDRATRSALGDYNDGRN